MVSSCFFPPPSDPVSYSQHCIFQCSFVRDWQEVRTPTLQWVQAPLEVQSGTTRCYRPAQATNVSKYLCNIIHRHLRHYVKTEHLYRKIPVWVIKPFTKKNLTNIICQKWRRRIDFCHRQTHWRSCHECKQGRFIGLQSRLWTCITVNRHTSSLKTETKVMSSQFIAIDCYCTCLLTFVAGAHALNALRGGVNGYKEAILTNYIGNWCFRLRWFDHPEWDGPLSKTSCSWCPSCLLIGLSHLCLREMQA